MGMPMGVLCSFLSPIGYCRFSSNNRVTPSCLLFLALHCWLLLGKVVHVGAKYVPSWAPTYNLPEEQDEWRQEILSSGAYSSVLPQRLIRWLLSNSHQSNRWKHEDKEEESRKNLFPGGILSVSILLHPHVGSFF